MIKSFDEFIFEYNKYKRTSRGEIVEGTPDKVKEILEKYVPWYDVENVKMPLYRAVMVGTTTKPDFTYKKISPSKFIRKAPTTENYYNVIIDNSERWKDYPKRSKSVMTHTEMSKTHIYGNKLYRVIPIKENSKCAYVDNDYWMAFTKLFDEWPFGKIETLNEFNGSIRSVFNLKSRDYSSSKLKSLLNSNNLNLENLSAIMKKDSIDKWKASLKSIESKYGTFYDWVEELMDPKNTKVGILNYNNDSNLPKIYHRYEQISMGYEVWTDADCLLVDETLLK